VPRLIHLLGPTLVCPTIFISYTRKNIGAIPPPSSLLVLKAEVFPDFSSPVIPFIRHLPFYRFSFSLFFFVVELTKSMLVPGGLELFDLSNFISLPLRGFFAVASLDGT